MGEEGRKEGFFKFKYGSVALDDTQYFNPGAAYDNFAPKMTFGNVYRHFLLSHLGVLLTYNG